MRGLWYTKKNGRRLALWAVTLIATTVGVVAAEDVKVEPLCPSSITRGGPLNIDLRLINKTSTTVTIARSGLVAHLGNLNVLGPFVIPLTDTLNPFETITQSGYLKVPFPTNASPGTFTSVGVGVFNQANKVLGGGGCLIEVK